MVARSPLLCLVLFACSVCACVNGGNAAGMGTGVDGHSSVSTLTQAEKARLERLFDLTGVADHSIAENAARDVTELKAGQAEYVFTLWPVRRRELQAAERIGLAHLRAGEGERSNPEQASEHVNQAVRWLERALSVAGTARREEPWLVRARIRLELARCWEFLGRKDLALELVFNHADPRPLPEPLAQRYTALQDRLTGN